MSNNRTDVNWDVKSEREADLELEIGELYLAEWRKNSNVRTVMMIPNFHPRSTDDPLVIYFPEHGQVSAERFYGFKQNWRVIRPLTSEEAITLKGTRS